MATERKKIGIVFISDDIGVVYYLVNNINTLNFLPESKRPEVIVFYNLQCKIYLSLLNYPGLSFVEVNINPENRLKLYLKSILMRRNFIYHELNRVTQVDGYFPFNDFPAPAKGKADVASWIPDFQHKFYPQFFTHKNLVLREKRFRSIIDNTKVLVLSSYSALDNLKSFYRIREDLDVKVLQFVSLIRDHPVTLFNHVKLKYRIEKPFFLVSNQFYEHKNHFTVLNAVKILKEKGLQFTVVFSGKTEDYRNPKFFSRLLKYIEANELGSHVNIVGLIPREDQLSMLKNSLSIIQPSKFEGWSTFIEDAKSLSHQIICSSIPVHIEQIGQSGFYFNSDSPEQLALLMSDFIEGKAIKKELRNDYDKRALDFAESFITIFDKT